jgi:hypothetical protein
LLDVKEIILFYQLSMQDIKPTIVNSNKIKLSRMAKSIYLSTYHIKLVNNTKDEQVLNHFNGSSDLFDVMADFFNDLYKNPRQENNDEEKGTIVHFTLTSPPTVNKKDRIIYGFINSGLSGDDSDILDIATNDIILSVDPDKHGSFKDLFFYCKIPTERKRGFLILQKRSNFGVKVATETMIKKWLRSQGYMNVYFSLVNVVNGEVFNLMLSRGNLKKVELIYNWAPETPDDLMANPDGGVRRTKGKMKTVISSNTTLGDDWKSVAYNVVNKISKRTTVEIYGDEKEFDEMQFELEFNGKRKTFYAKAQHRTLPDIDVTSDIKSVGKRLVLQDLLDKSEELIREVFNYKDDV